MNLNPMPYTFRPLFESVKKLLIVTIAPAVNYRVVSINTLAYMVQKLHVSDVDARPAGILIKICRSSRGRSVCM
jgi:hypothetical protein